MDLEVFPPLSFGWILILDTLYVNQKYLFLRILYCVFSNFTFILFFLKILFKT